MTIPDRPDRDEASLRIRWSSVGISGIIIAIASLGTLVTVVTLQSIDALSTVALVLAVLAFVVQIIVFIAQATAANDQMRSVQTINAETHALLAELRGSTQNTNDLLQHQYSKVLDGLMATVAGTLAVDSDNDGNPSERELRKVLMNELRNVISEARQVPLHVDTGGLEVRSSGRIFKVPEPLGTPEPLGMSNLLKMTLSRSRRDEDGVYTLEDRDVQDSAQALIRWGYLFRVGENQYRMTNKGWKEAGAADPE